MTERMTDKVNPEYIAPLFQSGAIIMLEYTMDIEKVIISFYHLNISLLNVSKIILSPVTDVCPALELTLQTPES